MHRRRRSSLHITIALFGFLWLTVCAEAVAIFAQADVANSTIKGKVADQSNAAVGGATVIVMNSERGLLRSVKTNSEGTYNVPSLRPGTYDLRVEASGFQSQVLQKLVLTVGQVGVYDIRLQIGQINEEVSVRAAPTVVETARTQQSDNIERSQISNLPNFSRHFTSYIFVSSASHRGAARVSHNWLAGALDDVTFSPIITLRSGFPFNLYIGRDVNGDLIPPTAHSTPRVIRGAARTFIALT